jgi:two-component system chemotaxis response regulator CheV
MQASDAQSTSPAKQGEGAGILLESGTNELEVLVFGLGDQIYGVNVAKVREVIRPLPVSSSPGQPDCVNGVFNLRGGVLPLVDLHRYFDIASSQADEQSKRVIVTEFNGARSAFLVDSVDQIYRMSWSAMQPAPDCEMGEQFAVTGITKLGDRLLLMLDFEAVYDHISMQAPLHREAVDNPLGVDRAAHHVVIAEDSKFVREMMIGMLERSGYADLIAFSNGKDAMEHVAALESSRTERLVVVADIEMPQMDGLALTRRLKADAATAGRPVLLFSSLIYDDVKHKGEAVGADDQIAKPQLPELIERIDRLLAARPSQTPEAA